jgi:Ca2+-binding RTX toxin-like protein
VGEGEGVALPLAPSDGVGDGDGVGVPPLAFSDTISAARGTTQVQIDLRDIRFNDYDPDGGAQDLVGFNTITPAGVSTNALLNATDVDAAGFDSSLYPFGLLVVNLTSPLTAPIKLQYRSVLENQAFGTSDTSSEATITINPVQAVYDRILGSFGAETFIPYAQLLANDGPGAVFGGISNAYIFGGSILDDPGRGGIVINSSGFFRNSAFFEYSLVGYPGTAFVEVDLNNSPPITTAIARVVTPGTSFSLSFDDIRYKVGNFDPDGGSEPPLVNVSGAASLGVTYSLSANGIDLTFPSTYSGGFSLQYTLTDQPLLARSLPGTITFLTAAPPAPVTVNEVLNWGINSDGRTIYQGGSPGFGELFPRQLLANDTVMPGTIVVANVNDTTPEAENRAISSIRYVSPGFEGVTSRSDIPFGFEFKDNFTGSDTYQYTVYDPLGRSATGLITLNVIIPQPVLTNNVILVPVGATTVTVSAAEILGNDAFVGTGAIAEILPNAVITTNDSGVSIGAGYTRIDGFTLTFDLARTLDSYDFNVRTFDTAAAGGSASGFQRVTFRQGSSDSSGPTEGNDTLIGTEGADTIDALGGDDSVLGLGGNDSLLGSNGNDTLDGGNGRDTLAGGNGNDSLLGGSGGNNSLLGDAGNDTLVAGAGDNQTLLGGEGADSLQGGSGQFQRLSGDAGNDTLVAGGGTSQNLYSGNGSDCLQGGNGGFQLLDGEGGSDTLLAGEGNDQILYGGSDADSLLGGNGGYQDLYGDAGNDTLVAGGGIGQNLYGGFDADSLQGGNGVGQQLGGEGGSDTLVAGGGVNQALSGGNDADSLQGGNGVGQVLYGEAGNDTLVAGVGVNQNLSGGADAEAMQDARRNAPLRVMTLGRVVSLRDYEDFARGFASVAKARADWTFDGFARPILVTVAGQGGTLLDEAGPDMTNLRAALAAAGEADLRVTVRNYDPVGFGVSAQLYADPAYMPADLIAAATQALQTAFGFDARELGQSVSAAQVIAALQSVPGVMGVDLDQLWRNDELPGLSPRLPAAVAQPDLSGGTPAPAELMTLDLNAIHLEVTT